MLHIYLHGVMAVCGIWKGGEKASVKEDHAYTCKLLLDPWVDSPEIEGSWGWKGPTMQLTSGPRSCIYYCVTLWNSKINEQNWESRLSWHSPNIYKIKTEVEENETSGLNFYLKKKILFQIWLFFGAAHFTLVGIQKGMKSLLVQECFQKVFSIF